MPRPADRPASDEEQLRVEPPERSAAGLPGVVWSAAPHRSPRRACGAAPAPCCSSTRPTASTARAAPGPSRPTALTLEFCENGAKAVAEEATLRRVDAGVLRRAPGRRPRRSAATTGSASRAGSPSRCASRPGADHYEPISLGRRLRPASPASCARSTTPDRAVFYTSGRTSNEAAFLYQLLVRPLRHEQPARLLEHVPRVERRRPHRDDRRRQGHGHARRRRRRPTCILVVGQNPGTNHPRMLTALEEAKRRRRPHRRRQPAARGRAAPVQEPAARRGRRRPGHRRWPTCSCRSGSAATSPCSSSSTACSCSRRPTRRARPRVHRRAQRRLRRAGRRTSAPLDADDAAGRDRARRATTSTRLRRPRRRRPTRIIVCWAMGLTQHRNAVATIREIVNFAAAAGQHRPAGRRASARCAATATCRATARWASTRSRATAFLDRARRREFGFEPPRAATATTPSTPSGRWRDGRGRRVRRHGRQLRGRRARHRGDRRGAAPLPAHRAGLDQAQPLARRSPASRPLILPCLGRTERDRTGGREQFVTVEDSMSVVHASRGPPRAGVARTCAARWRSSAGWPAAPLGDATASTGPALAARLRPHPRPHRSRSCPASSDFNERVREPGGFALPNAAPRRAARSRPPPAGPGSPSTRSSRSRCPPGRLLLQTIRSTTSTTRRSTASTTATAASSQGRRVVFVHPDDLAALGLRRRRGRRRRQRVDATASSAGRRAFRLVAYPVAAGHLRGLLPRGQRARAARQHRRGQRHADVEVRRRPPRATLGLTSELELEPHRLAHPPSARSPTGSRAGRGCGARDRTWPADPAG